MAAFNSLAAGSKVYNGGSNSANRGRTLDPGGYIQRSRMQEAAQQASQQGGIDRKPPQNRSGLAQAANQQLQPTQVPGQGGQGGGGSPNIPLGAQSANPADVGGLAPLNLYGGSSGLQQSGQLNQIQAFDPSAPDLGSGGAPTVAIPGLPTSITGDLQSPLDRDLLNQQTNSYANLNQMIADLTSQLNNASTSYQQDIRDVGTDQEKAFQQLAAQFASQGGGPGTGFGNAYQDLTNEFANYRSDLDTYFGQQQQDLLSDRTEGISGYQRMLEQLLGTQTDRDAKKAAEKRLSEKQAADKKKAAAKKPASPAKKAASPAKKTTTSKPKPKAKPKYTKPKAKPKAVGGRNVGYYTGSAASAAKSSSKKKSSGSSKYQKAV